MLAALSVSLGRVLTNNQLLQRVWGPNKAGGSGPVRNIINEPRVGYRMEEGETQEEV